MRPINLHINNTKNIGDRFAAPYLYYPEFDVGDLATVPQKDLKRPVVYGGGAVISSSMRHASLQSGPTFLWGAGQTKRWEEKHEPADLRAFSLAGTRDYGQGQWLPCVSCKHDAFDQDWEIKHSVVMYGHKKLKPLDSLMNAPYLDNECQDIYQVIEFLASGEKIITSSYHGAYWGKLLGKKVEVIAWGSKFSYLPEDLDLDECRKLNNDFFNSVMSFL